MCNNHGSGDVLSWWFFMVAFHGGLTELRMGFRTIRCVDLLVGKSVSIDGWEHS